MILQNNRKSQTSDEDKNNDYSSDHMIEKRDLPHTANPVLKNKL